VRRFLCRLHLRNEERGEKERVAGHLDDSRLTLRLAFFGLDAGGYQTGFLQCKAVLGIQAEAAIILNAAMEKHGDESKELMD